VSRGKPAGNAAALYIGIGTAERACRSTPPGRLLCCHSAPIRAL
jgi:hypothetical protein